MGAIFKREFKAFFISPMGYIFLGIMAFFQGLGFSSVYVSASTDIGLVFENMLTFVFVLIPVLTMRTMSEDRKQKVDQVLLTSPVSLYSIVLGKFLATLSIFMLSYSLTVVFEIIIAFQNVTVNLLEYIGNILGTALIGSALIALGIFISSLTESQLVSAVCSFTATMFIYMLDLLAALVNKTKFTDFIDAISFIGRYNTFTEGIIDYSNIVYFIMFGAVFIFLTVRVLDKRRYS